MVTPEPCAGCGDATAPACPHASTPTPRDLGCHAACVHSASTTPEVSAMLLTSPPQPPTPAHTQSHARHRLVGGLGLLDQAKLLCDARPAQTRRQGLGVGGGVRGWGGGRLAGSVWGLGDGVGTSVSAVACWRAPAPPVAILRLQDQLRQVLVQEEEADRSDGDAPARGLHEVGSGEADG